MGYHSIKNRFSYSSLMISEKSQEFTKTFISWSLFSELDTPLEPNLFLLKTDTFVVVIVAGDHYSKPVLIFMNFIAENSEENTGFEALSDFLGIYRI